MRHFFLRFVLTRYQSFLDCNRKKKRTPRMHGKWLAISLSLASYKWWWWIDHQRSRDKLATWTKHNNNNHNKFLFNKIIINNALLTTASVQIKQNYHCDWEQIAFISCVIWLKASLEIEFHSALLMFSVQFLPFHIFFFWFVLICLNLCLAWFLCFSYYIDLPN